MPHSSPSKVAERIPLNERHLKRLLSEYIRYHHLDRTHLGLKKDTPPWPTMHKTNS